MSKAVILLSGGLDSYVALDIASKNNDVILAINFNYGQKAFIEEHEASSKIAEKYNIKLETINLPYLEKLCNNALTDNNNDKLDDFKEVWIPNRNGLFINIAGCFCDKLKIEKIVLGLNLEEARDFSDNSEDFVQYADKFLYYSTQIHPSILAPCSKMTKVDIVNYTIDNNLPLDIIKSCYNSKTNSSKKHCGKCMSCKLLYNAILKSKKPELIKEIF